MLQSGQSLFSSPILKLSSVFSVGFRTNVLSIGVDSTNFDRDSVGFFLGLFSPSPPSSKMSSKRFDFTVFSASAQFTLEENVLLPFELAFFVTGVIPGQETGVTVSIFIFEGDPRSDSNALPLPLPLPPGPSAATRVFEFVRSILSLLPYVLELEPPSGPKPPLPAPLPPAPRPPAPRPRPRPKPGLAAMFETGEFERPETFRPSPESLSLSL